MKENISIAIAVLAIVFATVAVTTSFVTTSDFTIGAGTISGNELASNSVTGDNIVDDTITDDYGAEDSTSKSITVTFLNHAPGAPDIDGPIRAKAGVELDYHFVSEDLDGDDIYYYIDWDDGTVEDWFGPFGSGEVVVVSHVWDEMDIYAIKTKAEDTFGAESDWGYFSIEIPRIKVIINSLVMRFLEQFPNSFTILQKILGL